MSGIDSLARALSGQAQSPCDKYSCNVRQRCAAEKLACGSFLRYVRTGAAHSPYLEIPERITKRVKPVQRNEIVATREIFNALDLEA